MALKPSDIKSKEFNTKFNGFDPDEVNKFLKQVFNDYSDLLKQIKDLKSQNTKDSKLAKEYLSKKHILNSSILVAQQAADNLKAKARKEVADAKTKSDKQIKANEDKSASQIKTNDMKSDQRAKQIVASAKDEANNILENAGRKANRLSAKTATLWRGTKDIHTRAVKLSKAFLSSVDSSDWSKILNDGNSQSKKTLDHANEVSKVYHDSKSDNLASKSSNK